MIILDTDVLTIIQRRAGREYEKLADRLDLVEDEVVVSIISFGDAPSG